MATIARYKPNSTATFSATILDAAGAVVPAADLTTATLTLKRGSTVINSRDSQNVLNVNNVAINSSGGMVWSVQVADVAATTRCEHRAEFVFTTSSGETITATHRMYISPTIALTSFEDVQTLLGDLSDSDQLLLEQIADGITDRCETYTGRKFARVTDHSEVVSAGSKDSTVAVKHFPLVSVSKLYEDVDGDFTSTTEVDAEDYYVNTDEGLVELRGGGSFVGGPGSVKITYTGGFEDIGDVPMDLRMAATRQAAFAFQRRASSGISSESVNGMSVTRYAEDLLPELKAVLGYHQQRVVL